MRSENSLDQRLIEPAKPPATEERLGLLSEIWLLTYKNIILTLKNPKNLLFLVITPFILSGFMAAFQQLARQGSKKIISDPQPYSVPIFPKCGWDDCVTLDYRIVASSKEPAPASLVWIDSVLKTIRSKAGLASEDVTTGEYIVDSIGVREYYNKFASTPNKTQIGVIFCAEASTAVPQFCDGSHNFTYYLMVRQVNSMAVIFHDLLEPFPVDVVPVSLKLMIDNAILELSQGGSGSVSWMDYVLTMFPVGPNRYIQNYDMVTTIGAFYYLITPLFAFLFIQNQIVREKEYRLRQGLNIFGASHTSYWLSWFFIANCYALVGSVSTYLAGLAFSFGFFTDTPFYIIIFFMMYPFMLAIQMMSFFLSTLSPTLKAANAISYALVLLAIVVESFVADNNILQFLFSENASLFVQILRVILLFYPPFSYTKIFTNITQHSGYHFDIQLRQWVLGTSPYTIDTFTQADHNRLPFGNQFYTRYSDLLSFAILLGSAVFYIILTWYFDNVIAANRGRGESVWFPLRRLRQLCSKPKSKINHELSSKKAIQYFVEGEEESAAKERARVFQNSTNGIPAIGMRVKYLSKTFTKRCSKDRMEAISHLSLEIEPNELMAVLGHNGAGKTTLINVLTGVLRPDEDPETEIMINQKSITCIDDIRKHIGVCSQFDILWNELTAHHHLYMFALLKNVPRASIEAKIDEILAFVNLSREKNNCVKGFSGGMRRRLSLAIAVIGDPKILLLDEPTTGLDPKVKQQVWQLIERMKQNKSIILTTHSMEEADVLADRICVMARGRLKCIGTSLYLKQKYGEGHRLTLNIDRETKEKTLSVIHSLFPTAIFIDYKGGNLIVGISDFECLLRFVKLLESQDSMGLDQHSLKSAVKDWNVSHSTLEEVFMKVTREKESQQ